MLMAKELKDEVEHELKNLQSQHRLTIAHIESMIKVMSSLVEMILTKVQVNQQEHSRRNSHSQCLSDFGATNLSSSTDQFDKSYEDERRNLIESIRNILIAKIEAV
jgi:hypothetical protein